MFGRIAFCNTVSDLYAMGITDIKEVLMILGVSTQMDDLAKDVCTKLMIEGFCEAATQAGTQVGGGQTVYNMWPMMGGCAITVVKDDGFRMPNQAKPGQKIVLTKPLGTRLAINAMQWLKTDPIKREKLLQYNTQAQIEQAFYRAEANMATLSLVGAELIRKYNVSACTDVTGFGILGHARYLAQAQKRPVDLLIHTLPVYRNLLNVNKVNDYKFTEGFTAQTSGGLLMCIDADRTQQLLSELNLEGVQAWEIGSVLEGTKTANLAQNVKCLQV